MIIKSYILKVFCVSALLIQHVTLWAEDIEQTEVDFSEEGAVGGKVILSGRSLIGNGYLSITRMIDNMLAGAQLEREENESYLKFTSQGTWFDDRPEQYDNKFKAKLHLPGVKKKFRLFLDSSLSENNSLQDRNRSVATGEKIAEEQSVAGLEFSKGNDAGQWKRSVSAGAKLNNKLNTFVRFSLKKLWDLSDHWSSYYRQDLWYLDGVGWGETSRWQLTRTLSDNAWFQVQNELEIKDEAINYEYGQIWQINHHLNERYGLNYRIGVIGEGSASANYFTNVTLSYLLYQDWVFLNLTPEVFFQKENDHRTENSFTIKLEVFFND